MTDINEGQRVRGETQPYLKKLFDKYNANPKDPELSDTERAILSKVGELQNSVGEKVDKLNKLNKESQTLTQQITHLQGQIQGCLGSLTAVKSISEG